MAKKGYALVRKDQAKHEQDMRRRLLSVPQPRLRLTNKRATLIQRQLQGRDRKALWKLYERSCT
jgi:hypothetical protein